MGKKNRPTGPCALCSEVSQLHQSHIYPRFAYLDYLMDRVDPKPFYHAKGQGSTVQQNLKTSKQQKPYLLCSECEDFFGKSETKAKPLLLRVSTGSADFVSYEPWFFTFVSSIAWRVAHAAIPDLDAPDRNCLKPAARTWKSCLLALKAEASVGIQRGYTHHCYVDRGVLDGVPILSKTFGAQFDFERGFIFWRLGPLTTFSLFDRRHFSAVDRARLSDSEVALGGGIVREIERGRVEDIPRGFGEALNEYLESLMLSAQCALQDQRSRSRGTV